MLPRVNVAPVLGNADPAPERPFAADPSDRIHTKWRGGFGPRQIVGTLIALGLLQLVRTWAEHGFK